MWLEKNHWQVISHWQTGSVVSLLVWNKPDTSCHHVTFLLSHITDPHVSLCFSSSSSDSNSCISPATVNQSLPLHENRGFCEDTSGFNHPKMWLRWSKWCGGGQGRCKWWWQQLWRCCHRLMLPSPWKADSHTWSVKLAWASLLTWGPSTSQLTPWSDVAAPPIQVNNCSCYCGCKSQCKSAADPPTYWFPH